MSLFVSVKVIFVRMLRAGRAGISYIGVVIRVT